MKKSSKKRSARLEVEWPKQVYADLSTSHISELDGRHLFSVECGSLVIGETMDGSGHFLSLGEKTAAEIRGLGFSKAFAALMLRLRVAGFNYVRLDADAPVVKGLRTYKW